jgi:hypothetical protein
VKAALNFIAEFAVACLIAWGTIEVLAALQPGPWLVPKYGTWIE